MTEQQVQDPNEQKTEPAAVTSEVPQIPAETSRRDVLAMIDQLNEASEKRKIAIQKESAAAAAKILTETAESMSAKDSKFLESAVAGILDIAASLNGAIGSFTSEMHKANSARIQTWTENLSKILASKQMLEEGKDYAARPHHEKEFRVPTNKGLIGSVKDFGESMRLVAMRAVIDKDVATLRYAGEKYHSTSELFTGFSVGLRAMSEKIRPAKANKEDKAV